MTKILIGMLMFGGSLHATNPLSIKCEKLPKHAVKNILREYNAAKLEWVQLAFRDGFALIYGPHDQDGVKAQDAKKRALHLEAVLKQGGIPIGISSEGECA